MAVRIAVRRRAGRRVSLTPLIDVVFILLVFFMLETTFLREGGLHIAAPEPGARAAVAGRQLTIELLEMDSVWIDGRRFDRAEWTGALGAADETAVRLRAGAGVSVQRVVEVLDALHAHGFRDVTVDDVRGFGP